MKYIFIINNFGNNDPSFIYKRIIEVCDNLKLDYTLELNSQFYTTDMILKKYQDKQDIIIAVGGDGMINKVANGIANTDNILGYIPYGTGNDFHKTVIDTMEEGITPIDLVKINNQYFINIACFGIDADIANDEKIIHNKFIPKSQRYNLSVIYHFIKYHSRKLEILIDKDTIINDFSTVVLANGRYYGGGYKVGTNSSLTDGLLDVYLFRDMPKIKMAKSILGMKNGSHEFIPELQKIATSKLCIKSETPFKSNIDGEMLESDEFNIELNPKKLKLYNNQDLIKRILK